MAYFISAIERYLILVINSGVIATRNILSIIGIKWNKVYESVIA